MNQGNSLENKFLAQFLESVYGIRGKVSRLAGYQDRNYLITCSSEDRYILKITMAVEDLEFIRSQNRVLLALSQKPVGKI
ncbi:MAG: hypothetical protein WCW62_11955, partial [Bacteroidales bacterium]